MSYLKIYLFVIDFDDIIRHVKDVNVCLGYNKFPGDLQELR